MVNLRLHLSMSGVKFPFLVRELRSHKALWPKNPKHNKEAAL